MSALAKDLYSGVYPQRCTLCAAPASGDFAFCGVCFAGLPFNNSACRTCASSLAGLAGEDMVCGSCQRTEPIISRTMALFRYAFPVDAIILRLKSNGGMAFIPAVARILADVAMRQLPRPECVIAMPLHPRRLRQRGFNQSYEIARILCDLWQVPLDNGYCLRVRNTAQQQGLNHGDRIKNVRGAFAVQGKRQYRQVLLLDDVITTGSTINALAKTIKKAGVERVDALCLAKVVSD